MNDSVHENDLLGLIEGDLPSDRTAAVRAALDRDPALRARVESMTLDRAALRALGAERFAAPAGLIADALDEAERAALVEADPIAPEPVTVYRFARYRAVAVAAVGLIAAGAVLLALRPTIGGAPPAPTRLAKAPGVPKDADHHGAPTPPVADENPAATEPEVIASSEPSRPEHAGHGPLGPFRQAEAAMGVMGENEGASPGVGQSSGDMDAAWLETELSLATHGGLEIRVVASDPDGVVQALTDFGGFQGRGIAMVPQEAEAGVFRAVVTFEASADELMSLLTAISQVAGERSFFFERAGDHPASPINGRESRATVSVRIERAQESN